MSSTDISKPLRPILLMLTMLMCIVMGWSGMAMGCNNIQTYRSPGIQEPPMRAGEDPRVHEQVVALTQAMRPILDEARMPRLPLSIANMLLSALLVIATTRALGGRAGAWGLAVQAIVANALLSVAEFVLTPAYRARSAEVFSQYFAQVIQVEGGGASESPENIAIILRASFIAVFASTLGAYAIALLALFRPSSRAYLAAVDADDETTDPDEI